MRRYLVLQALSLGLAAQSAMGAPPAPPQVPTAQETQTKPARALPRPSAASFYDPKSHERILEHFNSPEDRSEYFIGEGDRITSGVAVTPRGIYEIKAGTVKFKGGRPEVTIESLHYQEYGGPQSPYQNLSGAELKHNPALLAAAKAATENAMSIAMAGPSHSLLRGKNGHIRTDNNGIIYDITITGRSGTGFRFSLNGYNTSEYNKGSNYTFTADGEFRDGALVQQSLNAHMRGPKDSTEDWDAKGYRSYNRNNGSYGNPTTVPDNSEMAKFLANFSAVADATNDFLPPAAQAARTSPTASGNATGGGAPQGASSQDKPHLPPPSVAAQRSPDNHGSVISWKHEGLGSTIKVRDGVWTTEMIEVQSKFVVTNSETGYQVQITCNGGDIAYIREGNIKHDVPLSEWMGASEYTVGGYRTHLGYIKTENGYEWTDRNDRHNPNKNAPGVPKDDPVPPPIAHDFADNRINQGLSRFFETTLTDTPGENNASLASQYKWDPGIIHGTFQCLEKIDVNVPKPATSQSQGPQHDDASLRHDVGVPKSAASASQSPQQGASLSNNATGQKAHAKNMAALAKRGLMRAFGLT